MRFGESVRVAIGYGLIQSNFGRVIVWKRQYSAACDAPFQQPETMNILCQVHLRLKSEFLRRDY